MKNKDFLLSLAVLVAIAAGLALRLYLVWHGGINSDEAIVGLMGMEILKGHHFAFYWGQAYMGSLEAYAAALLFHFFGVSVAVLKIVPMIFFIAAAWFHFLFVYKILGNRIALITVGLLFFSPPVFTIWSVSPRGGYMEALAFGGAALILAMIIKTRPGGKGWGRHLLLGMVCGIGFWTHYFFVYYLVPIFFLVVLPDLFSSGRLKKIGGMAAGFLAGASPVIIYNIKNLFSSLGILDIAASVGIHANLNNLVVRQLPTLLGANNLVADRPLWNPFSWLLLAVFLISTFYYPFEALRRSNKQRGRPLSVLLLPFCVVIVMLVLFLGTGFGAFNTQRYLLPMYPMLAIFMAVFLNDLASGWKRLTIVLCVFILSVNLFGNWNYYYDKYRPKSAAVMDSMHNIIDYCRANGIKTAYSGHWICYALTFLSRQKLVVADIDRDRYLPFQSLVAESPYPSIITEAYRSEIAATLKAIGYRFKIGELGRYTVFDSPRLRREIGQSAGRKKIWVQETDGGEFEAIGGGGVISRSTQEKRMSVTFSLGEKQVINGIIVSPGKFAKYYPRRFVVEISNDGIAWERVASARPYVGTIYHLGRLRFGNNGWISIYFEPRTANFIRLVLKRNWEERHWAVDTAWVSLAADNEPRQAESAR